MLTFEQVTSMVDVYSGTEVDSATKLVLADWLFDRYISAADDSMSSVNTWARWYKRYVNMNYPIYLDLLKMDLARSSMDPFITELIERLTSGDTSTLVSAANAKAGESSTSETGMRSDSEMNDGSATQTRTPELTSTDTSSRIDSDSTLTDNEEVRTPDLTHTDMLTGTENTIGSDATHSDVEGQNVRTPELITDTTGSNIRSDDLQSGSTSYHDDGMNKDGTIDSTDEVHTVIDADDSSKSRAMNITYPEANMNAIPQDIDNFPTSIDYAEGEADRFDKGEHDENNTATTTHNQHFKDETIGSNTGDVTTMDSNSSIVHGEETTNKTASEDKVGTSASSKDRAEDKTSTETGTDTKETDGSVTRTGSELSDSTHTETGSETTESSNDGSRTSTSADSKDINGETSENGTSTQSTIGNTDGSENVQGRHESMADILPRACSAIKSTNALKWFVNVLQPCFDNYAEM